MGAEVVLPASVLAALDTATGETSVGADVEVCRRPPVIESTATVVSEHTVPDPLRSPGPDWVRVVAASPEKVETELRRLGRTGQRIDATDTVPVRTGKKTLYLAWGKPVGDPKYKLPPRPSWRRAVLVGTAAVATVLAAAGLLTVWVVTHMSAIVGGVCVVCLLLGAYASLRSLRSGNSRQPAPTSCCLGCACGVCKGS